MLFFARLFLCLFVSVSLYSATLNKTIQCQAQVEGNHKNFSLNQFSLTDEDGLQSSSAQVDDILFRVAYVGGDQILLSIRKNKSDRTHIVVDKTSKIPKVILDVVDGRKAVMNCEIEK